MFVGKQNTCLVGGVVHPEKYTLVSVTYYSHCDLNSRVPKYTNTRGNADNAGDKHD